VALRQASRIRQVPVQRLRLVSEVTTHYPLTGKTIQAFKVMNKDSGEVYAVYLDAQGLLADRAQAAAEEREAYRTRYGKLERSLHQRMRRMREGATITVGIWTRVAARLPLGKTDVIGHGVALAPDARPDPGQPRWREQAAPAVKTHALGEETERVAAEGLQQRELEIARSQQPAVEWIERSGHTVLSASKYAPLLFAELPRSAIHALERLESVGAIYAADQPIQPLLHSAARTARAPGTWSRGITGQGTTVAVIEAGAIDLNHDDLAGNNGERDRYYHPDQLHIGTESTWMWHATQVAGVIASTAPADRNRGIAPDARLLSANAAGILGLAYVWDAVGATEWAIDQGADVLNLSWGWSAGTPSRSMNLLDRYYDLIVREHWKTVTAAAGNCDGNCNVLSPGKAYNVITVGAIDDLDTAEREADWNDDVASVFSSYVDPLSSYGDRNKPEVVAVGQRVRSTWVGNGWRTSDGTSFAAPAAAGEAALMMSRADWLKSWPETVKAVVMATARHDEIWADVDHSARATEDKIGAGCIDATAADSTLMNGRLAGVTLYPDSLPHSFWFEAAEGRTIRVAIAWDSHPTSWWWLPWASDTLKADLDLAVYAPSGSRVAGSQSWDNSYEFVEFTARATGWYRVEVQKLRWDAGNTHEYLGFAWDTD
jgi:subtilisin family serine protease